MEQHTEKSSSDNVLKTPIWISIIRGFQVLISLIIVICCGRLMHDAYLHEEGFCIAVSILTWIGIAYIVLSEKVSSLQSLYHIAAVLAIDALFLILWLAAWASTAALRASYVYNVNVSNCFDDGSTINSKSCNIFKRSVILFRTGLALLSAAAGLGALVWVLFIATFVWTLIQFLRGRKQGRFPIGSSGSSTPATDIQLESKIAEPQPITTPQTYENQPQPQQFQQQPAVAGQFAPGQQPQQYPQGTPYQQPQSPYEQTQSPYQQQAAYPPPEQSFTPQSQQQFQGQQPQGHYPPQQQPVYMQPVQPHGSELDGKSYAQYSTPPPAAVSPPPQQYQQPQSYPQSYPQN